MFSMLMLTTSSCPSQWSQTLGKHHVTKYILKRGRELLQWFESCWYMVRHASVSLSSTCSRQFYSSWSECTCHLYRIRNGCTRQPWKLWSVCSGQSYRSWTACTRRVYNSWGTCSCQISIWTFACASPTEHYARAPAVSIVFGVFAPANLIKN